ASNFYRFRDKITIKKSAVNFAENGIGFVKKGSVKNKFHERSFSGYEPRIFFRSSIWLSQSSFDSSTSPSSAKSVIISETSPVRSSSTMLSSKKNLVSSSSSHWKRT